MLSVKNTFLTVDRRRTTVLDNNVSCPPSFYRAKRVGALGRMSVSTENSEQARVSTTDNQTSSVAQCHQFHGEYLSQLTKQYAEMNLDQSTAMPSYSRHSSSSGDPTNIQSHFSVCSPMLTLHEECQVIPTEPMRLSEVANWCDAQLDEDGIQKPRGSKGHEEGTCNPCFFNHTKKGCTSGNDCDFCHLCPKDILSSARKNKSKLIKKLKRDTKDAEEWGRKRGTGGFRAPANRYSRTNAHYADRRA